MAGNASIVVDIKAQITGYEEQIAKVKEAMKKVDPGSAMGKSLMKTLEQADQKLTQLSRKAEQRITSQGQLDHLFDQLHQVNDLMRGLGQGMSNVGMDDVLLTSSEHARELGKELKTVQSDLQAKGKTFFDSLTGVDAKQLTDVFAQLKFDPAKMGVDDFIKSFDTAVDEAQGKLDKLKEDSKQATEEARAARDITDLRAKLPKEFQVAGMKQKDVKNILDSGRFASQGTTDMQDAARSFLDQIDQKISEEKDSDVQAQMQAAADKAREKLMKARDTEAVRQALQALNTSFGQITNNKEDLASLTGGKGVEDWANTIAQKIKVDSSFKSQVEQIIQVLTKDPETADAGNQIATFLQNLIKESDISVFESNMQKLIRVMTNGMNQLNSEANKVNVTGKEAIAQTMAEEVKKAQNDVNQLEALSNNPLFQQFRGEIEGLRSEITRIKTALGLENTNTKAGVAEDVNKVGQGLLNQNPRQAEDATNQLKEYSSALEDVQRRQQMVGKVEGIAQRWFSVYAAVRMVGKAFRSVKDNVTNLDKTITEIAIVTDKSQSDLWSQMPEYTAMARKYGASLQGVYEVSQLYYQQGLEQNDVMALTEQTLKMARISGLDYTDATNYMTNAIRSFKIEMQDSQRVVDVYSALAASSASSTSELATAMSKTASSAAAVGSSFENTSAMMAVMIETTRESPENIGSALKSIISRYGELKENKTGIDEEGEEYSLNKVDTALQSVGISIHDANGEFRDFDDVITELSGKWDTIDKNTQRYIATVMAGNRQQSRFLALVSNGERLAELSETAANSEDAATLQVLKTMDSIDYKSQQLQTTLQSLYTSTGVETFYKGILDGANQVVKTFTDMPTLFNLPIPAMMSVASNFISMANIVMTTLSVLKQKFTAQWNVEDEKQKALKILNKEEEVALERAAEEQKLQIKKEYAAKREALTNEEAASDTAAKSGMKTSSKKALAAQIFGTGMTMAAGMISDKGTGNRAAKATLGIGGSALQYGALGFQLSGHPAGAVIGGLLGAGMGLWQNFQYIFQSTAEQAKRLKEEAEEAQTTYKQKNATAKNIEKEIANVKKLAAAQYDSTEAREKYIEASNKLAEDLPELVSHYDEEGNAVLDLTNAYTLLANKRKEANDAATESVDASIKAAQKVTQQKQEELDIAIKSTGTKDISYNQLTGIAKEKWNKIITEAQGEDTYRLNQIQQHGYGVTALSGLVKGKIPEELSDLYDMVSNLQTEEGRELLGKDLLSSREDMVARWRNELKSNKTMDQFTVNILDFMIDQLETNGANIMKASGEAIGAQATERATIKSSVADYVNQYRQKQSDIVNYENDQKAISQAKENLELFTELNSTSEVMTNFIMQRFIRYGKSWSEFEEDANDGLIDAQNDAIELLKKIPQQSRKAINELFGKRDKYTQQQFTAELNKLIDPSITKEIMDAQASYYNTVLNNASFTSALATRYANEENKFKLTGLQLHDAEGNALYSGQELESMLTILDTINSMYKQGGLTESQGQKIASDYVNLWNGSTEAQQAILTNLDDFSEEGQKTINDMIDNSTEFESKEEKELFKGRIAQIFKNMPENINTAIETYSTNMSKATEEYNKDLSSATKGMDYKTAAEMAKKLDISTTTEYFDTHDGEMFLKNTQLLYDYYFGEKGLSATFKEKVKKNQENLNKHFGEVDKARKAWDKLDDEGKHEYETKTGLTINELDQLYAAFEETDESKLEDPAAVQNAFMKFAQTYYPDKIKGIEEQTEAYLKSTQLKSAIDSGDIKDIIKAGFTDKIPQPLKDLYEATFGSAEEVLEKELLSSLQSGDFSTIFSSAAYTDELKQKLPEMKVAYDEARSSVLTSLTDSIDAGYKYIEANDYNRDVLEEMEKQGLAELNKDANGKILGAILNNTVADIDQIYEFIEDYAVPKGLMTAREAREKLASLHQQKYELSTSSTFSELIQNYDKIGEMAFGNFLEAWQLKPEEVSSIFKQQADGSYKANLPKLAQFARDHMSELDELAQQQIEETLTKAIDDGMTSITSASDYVTKGTTKYSDMTAFVKQFNEALPGAQATIQDLFGYDKDAQGYVLDPQKYRDYLVGQKQMLQAMGESTEYIDGLIDNANQTLYDAIDIKSFIDAENRGAEEGSQARDKLKTALKNVGIWQEGAIVQSENWQDYYEELGGMSKEYNVARAKNLAEQAKKANNVIREEAAEEFAETIEYGGLEAVSAMQAIATLQGKELTSADIESAYRAQVSRIESASEVLSSGVGSLVSGEAIQMLEDAGYQLQSMGDGNTAVIEQIGNISQAYENYYIELYNTGEATLEALNNAKAKVLETKDGRDKEQKAIDALGNAAGMTYSTFGQLLTDMGIELTDDLIDELESSGITEAMGGNKMRIKDFAAFARRMNWDFNSEEYLSAFSSFNDGLVEQNRKNKTQAADELDKLKEAKPGDLLNLTYTSKELENYSNQSQKNIHKRLQQHQKTLANMLEGGNTPEEYIKKEQEAIEQLQQQDVFSQLQKDLLSFGASLQDGVLQLSDNANLLGIAETLKNAAIESGSEMSAQLQDMVRSIVSSYTDAITKGIEGGMTETERQDLIRKGADLGVQLDISDFQETMDGFQLTTNKALQLYNAMGRRDTKQQKKIYKTLSEQLKNTNSQYSTATSMLSKIASMQRELNELRQQGNDVNKERIEQLENELLLAKELQMQSLSHEDQTWNFMSNDAIPDSIDNALNYAANWGQAQDLLGKWGMSGKSDLNQFAALLQHVQEVATATGESVEFMGRKIDKNTYGEFLDKLSDMTEYNAKSGQWELSNAKLKSEMGFNMLLGSAGINQHLKDTIDTYTDMNADKLKDFNEFFDGLGSIYDSFNDYTDKANKHKFEDFLDPITGDFDYTGFMEQIGKNQKALDAFNKFTEKVKIDGKNYADVMGNAKGNIKKGSKEYNAIKGIIAMAMAENWDMESDYQAVAEQLSSSGFEGEIQLGDTLFTVREGRVVTQILTGDNAGYYDPYGGGPYENISQVWDAINRKDLEDYQKSINQYNQSQESSTETITLAGQTLEVIIENGKVILKQGETTVGEGETLTGAIADSQSKLTGTNASTYTAEGWLASQSTEYQNARVAFGGEGSTGVVTEQARATMQSKGLLTAKSIQDAYSAAIANVAAANNLEGANAAAENVVSQFGEAVAAEMYNSTGIKLDANKMPVSIDGDMAGKIADQVNMTQTAADVMNGLNAALASQATQSNLSNAMSEGLNKAFSDLATEGMSGDNAVKIEIKPELQGEDPLAEIRSQLENQTISVNVELVATPITGEGGTAEGPSNVSTTTDQTISVTPVVDSVPEIPGTSVEVSPELVGDIQPLTSTATYTGIFPQSAPTVHGVAIYTGVFPKGSKATGNVGLAHAKSTLMGELGPEMVVSGGRYFVVGQDGPEMVDLADDAIVFNHLQTESLLTKGTSNTRGHAITNERKAVAYAQGSRNGGPAHAGEGSVRDKQTTYRGASGVWDKATNTVFSGTTGAAEAATEALEAFIKELDRWYDQLQEIARLEEKVTYQEQLRAKINSDLSKNGSAYYKSLKQSITDLNDELVANQTLVAQQQSYLDKRIQVLNNSAFGALYKLENGQVKYKNNNVRDQFDAVFGQADTNVPNQTSKDQYQWLINQGYGEFMKYDKSGKEIKFTNDKGEEDESAYKTAVQAFWDRIDAQRDEVQGLVDSINEHQQAILEAQEAQNELVAEMRDNQLDLEEKVLGAIVEMREREIEEMQKERDVYADYSDKLVDGLSNALNKERQMYDMQDTQAETDRMRRRLAILQSSGGSASEISDLQSQIQQRDRDMYFDQQQLQIDAIKEASDLEIERLDNQIDLQNELLDYQKAHGLLWEEVYAQMQKTPEDITAFIAQNTADFWANSPAGNATELDNLMFSSEKWAEYRNELASDIESPLKSILESILANNGEKEWDNYVETLKAMYGEDFSGDDELKSAFLSKYKETSDPNQAGAAVQSILTGRGYGQSNGSGGGGGSASSGNGWVYDQPGKWIKSGDRWWYQHDQADASGKNYTTNNWERINGKWYHFDSEGWMQTGWFQDTDGKWYYLDDTKGSNEGAMLTGTHQLVWNGKKENHTFDGSGVWIGSSPINSGGNNKGWNAQDKKLTLTVNDRDKMLRQQGRAKGSAFAKGTLLGELGPEAYVSNGQFHIAGQYGAEFIDLPEDAIVFNHQQTARLLSTGLTSRGKAKNEDAAVGNDIRNSYIDSFWRSVESNRSTISASSFVPYSGSDAINSISTTDQGITIEHAEVNMNVEQLANDYDAKRAGEQALEEMLRIARKSGATAVRR